MTPMSSAKKMSGARLKVAAVPYVFHWTKPVKRRAPHDRSHSPPRKAVREPKSDSAKLKLEQAISAALQDQLDEALSAIEDVESNLCLKFFSLARFEDSDSDTQHYTGFPSVAAFMPAWSSFDLKTRQLCRVAVKLLMQYHARENLVVDERVSCHGERNSV